MAYRTDDLPNESSGGAELDNKVLTLKFKPGVSEKDAAAFEAAYRLKKLRQAITGFIDYEIAPMRDITYMYEAIKKSEIVETVDYNYYGRLLFQPNDPLYQSQWHLGRIMAPAAWSINAGSSEVVVAILDTGIEWAHPDLQESIYLNPNEDAWSNPFNPATGDGQDGIGGMNGNGFVDDWRGWNFLSNNNNTNDFAGPYVQNGHGTRVAGVIAARTNNAEGIAGIAGGKGQGGVKVMPVKIADGTSNSFNFSVVDDAILYAAQNGAKIIHMAFGIEGFTSYPAIDAAIQLAYEQYGVLLVAGSGNTGAAMLTYPASHPYVLSVGASNQYDVRWANSNYGSQLDLAAPGVDIITTNVAGIWGGPYTSAFSAQASGTSLASAMVTGAAALILSEYPCLTPHQVKTCLLQTADKTGGYNYNHNPVAQPGHSLEMGYGRVNAENAIEYVKSGLFPPSSTYPTLTYTAANTTLTGIVEATGHIEIATGATLTITGELRLLTNAHIIVRRGARLVVDGGTITRKLCFERWGSIYVEGNSELPQPEDPSVALDPLGPGVVWLRNGATIEYARNAISVRHYPNHWDSKFWGGLVVAENTVFYNNRRSVEFMRYDLPNRSRFIECEFVDEVNESFAGVTVWATDGIVFDFCIFTGLKMGVQVWDAGAEIRLCSFSDMQFGVVSEATSPVSSGGFLTVARSFFDRTDSHIEARSAGRPKGLNITQNWFENYFIDAFPIAIGIYGPSRYRCTDNFFLNTDIGISLANTYGWDNSIECNYHNGGNFAVAITGNNEGLEIRENQYASNSLNIILNGEDNQPPGSIAPTQGIVGRPAHNCFTPAPAWHITTIGATEPFFYFIPDVLSECIKTPQPSPVGTNNYFTVPTSSENRPECPFIPPIAPPQDGPFTYSDFLSAKNSSQYWEMQVAFDPQNSAYRAAYLSFYRLKNHIIDWFLSEAIANGQLEEAIFVLQSENTREAKRLAYGLLVKKNLYARADSILASIPLTDVYDEQFLVVQRINLARLQSEEGFELSPQQRTTLENIAYTKSPEREYARALLSLLEGYRFEPDRIEIPSPALLMPGTSHDISIPAQQATLFPNPAEDIVYLRLSPEFTGNGKVSLSDIYGRERIAMPWNEGDAPMLNVAGLPVGIYIVRVEQQGRLLFSAKFVKR